MGADLKMLVSVLEADEKSGADSSRSLSQTS